MLQRHEITLEDNGNDIFKLITNSNWLVLECITNHPLFKSLYKGAIVPIEFQEVGKPCKIYIPKIDYEGYLPYTIKSINKIRSISPPIIKTPIDVPLVVTYEAMVEFEKQVTVTVDFDDDDWKSNAIEEFEGRDMEEELFIDDTDKIIGEGRGFRLMSCVINENFKY